MTKTYLEIINKLIITINPILYIAFKDTPTIMLIFPIIPVVLEILFDMFSKDKTKIQKQTDSLPNISIDIDNIMYNKICWYLSSNIEIDTLRCIGNNASYLINHIYSGPIYSIDAPYYGSFKYQKNIIYVKVAVNENKKQLTIYSDKIDILKNLLNDITKMYDMFIRNGYDENNYISKIKTFNSNRSFGDSQWISNNIYVSKTKENVFLSKENERIFDIIDLFLKSEQKYLIKGIPYKKGFLLYGNPGCGKSSVVYAISNYTKMDIYKISSNDITDSNYRNVFSNIPTNSIILMEDIDTIESFHSRNNTENDKDTKSNTFNLESMLNVLDGYSYLHKCIVIFTTNHIEKIDKALIRHGRIDHVCEFKEADDYQIENIMKYYDCKIDINKPITTADLIQKCLLVSD